MKEGDIGTYTAIYLAHLPKKDQRLIADKLVQALADNEITVRQVRALRDELLQAVALSRLVSVGGYWGEGRGGGSCHTPGLGPSQEVTVHFQQSTGLLSRILLSGVRPGILVDAPPVFPDRGESQLRKSKIPHTNRRREKDLEISPAGKYFSVMPEDVQPTAANQLARLREHCRAFPVRLALREGSCDQS